MRTRRLYLVILELARRVPQFTARNLTPAMTIEQARRSCLALAERGELTVIVKGKAGRISAGSVYRIAK